MKSIIQFANDYLKSGVIPYDSKSSTPQGIIRAFALKASEEGFMKGGRPILPLKYKNSSVKATVTCEGLMYGMSGFAEAMRNVAYFLDKERVNVDCQPLDQKNSDNVDVTTTPKGKVIDRLSEIQYASDQKKIRISMTPPMGIRRSRDHDYQIAYIMFETKDFPKKFIKHLNANADEIWTPSGFNVNNIVNAGWKKPIYVMPLGVDTKRFDPATVETFTQAESPIAYFQKEFIFLSIMGWSERKGVSVLLEAYMREFKVIEPVVLYIKGGWYDLKKAWEEVFAIAKKLNLKHFEMPTIVLDFNIYKDEDLPKLYASSDAFVLPSRGEGWGLEYTEAMSMALPVIGTRATAQMEFMTPANSFLIDLDKKEPWKKEPRADWITPDYKGKLFANPSVSSLQKQMRKVFSNIELQKQIGEFARQDMKEVWTWEHAAAQYKKRLEDIAHA